MHFSKWQALGNDFIMIVGLPLESSLITALCHRRYGVGADGVIFLNLTPSCPQMHFFNADGSCVKMCGNGLRCALLYLQQLGLALEVELEGARYSAHSEGDRLYVLMPSPFLQQVTSPPYQGLWVSAGVPHFLIAKEDVHQGPLDREIFKHRYHPCFGAEGTNITFYQKQGSCFYLRTCERGVDEETLACGSAAIACSYLATESHLEMIYPTGKRAWVKKEDDKVYLAGEACFVFEGDFAMEKQDYAIYPPINGIIS